MIRAPASRMQKASRDTAAEQIQQNGLGDVVVPANGGEVVLLPRLWDLDLADVGAGGAVLRSNALTITVVFEDGGAAVVDVATLGPADRPRP